MANGEKLKLGIILNFSFSLMLNASALFAFIVAMQKFSAQYCTGFSCSCQFGDVYVAKISPVWTQIQYPRDKAKRKTGKLPSFCYILADRGD